MQMLKICVFPCCRLTGEYPFISRRYDHINNANTLKEEAESVDAEQTTTEMEAIAKQDPEITYFAGYRAFYKDDWRPRLNKQASRSFEGTLLLSRTAWTRIP